MHGEDVRRHNRADLVLSVFLTAFGIWLAIEASQIPTGTIHDPIGPSRLALFGGILFVLVGAGLVVRHIVYWRRGKVLVPDGVEDEPEFEASSWRAGAMWGLTLGFVLLLPIIGFLPVATAFMFAGMVLLGMRHWIKAVLVSVGVAVAVNLLFVHLLAIPLPSGTLW